MNMTCYIVDDEFHSVEVLKDYVGKTPGLELKGFSTDPLAALNDVVCPEPPSLVFLDIDMPELSGLEFAGLVSLYTRVIFTTSYPEYAIGAFEKEAVDYLLKPIPYDRFLRAVNRVKKQLMTGTVKGPPEKPWFFIKSEVKGKLLKITVADIVYVEALQNYVRIHSSAANHIAYLTMEEIQEHLPSDRFARIHRSFIINTDRIRSVEQGQVIMDNNEMLALGRLYKDKLLESVKELLVQSRRKLPG
jgi:two-component system, LytTR family, response regulator